MASHFLEDPRLRQRWNQISHTTEAVTENAAAGIWSFSHTYVNPCLGSIAACFDGCTTTCFGDREDRIRRARERERRAEYSFDFYDDWDEELHEGEDDGGSGGIFASWRHDDWDRLLAGSGRSGKKGSGEVQDQPRGRKQGMSYGTRGSKRKSGEEDDPTIIPSTQPIGFLGRLPFKIGGTLRYKPSAANLQEHPGAARLEMEGEMEPLLGSEDEDDGFWTDQVYTHARKRSGTAGSGDTSDSYRSRGDLFPSDGEGEEDAMELGDEFAFALDRVNDDHSSNKTKRSKGKRKEGQVMPRSTSRTTIASTGSKSSSLRPPQSSTAVMNSPAAVESSDLGSVKSMEDLHHEEQKIQEEEDAEIERKRQAAAQLATERGLHQAGTEKTTDLTSQAAGPHDIADPGPAQSTDGDGETEDGCASETKARGPDAPSSKDGFVPARLPYFQ